MIEITIKDRSLSWKSGFKKIKVGINANGFIHTFHNTKEKIIYIICEREKEFDIFTYTEKGIQTNMNTLPYKFLRFSIKDEKETYIVCQEEAENGRITTYEALMQGTEMSSKEVIKPYGYNEEDETEIQNYLNQEANSGSTEKEAETPDNASESFETVPTINLDKKL